MNTQGFSEGTDGSRTVCSICFRLAFQIASPHEEGAQTRLTRLDGIAPPFAPADKYPDRKPLQSHKNSPVTFVPSFVLR
jgi:hypothetical protein